MPDLQKLTVANWKMNLTSSEGAELVKSCFRGIGDLKTTRVCICPPFTALSAVSQILHKTEFVLGAQNMSWQADGSLTGEISGGMLKEYGVQFVIIGHSERRQHLGETDQMVHDKVKAALAADLTPIVCVGETFEERQAGRKDFVVSGQVEAALKDIQLSHRHIYIAYEPVWVIGSGQAVEVSEAEHTARIIKQVFIDLYPDLEVKDCLHILYGGSVDSTNVASFMGSEELVGVLVGGASLKADEFVKIVQIVDSL